MRSFTAPFTDSGRSSLVAPPPWHYAGWLFNIAFRFDTTLASTLIPEAVGRPVGRGCIHFADWQACSTRNELVDPVFAQYRETIVVLEVEQPGGGRCLYCPSIWVDQDISLIRGLLQGWPKKMGSTWMTRCLPIDHPAAAPLKEGTQLGASLAVKDRRLLDARLTLTGRPGKALGFLSMRTVGAVGWPDLRSPEAYPQPTLVQASIRDRVDSGWHHARATLSFSLSPYEEVSELGPVLVSEASVGWVGLTVTGASDA